MDSPDEENRPPVPLKHHTETALMLLLGLAIALTGFVCSLLPAFPAGALYWSILFALTVLYPLVLSSFFRSNRADYEFRLLHWLPALMTVLWLLFELLSYRFNMTHAIQLGFFSLWSLPLVALGIGLVIMFSVHVIRRRNVRITYLTLLLALFAAGAWAAHAQHWNTVLQAALFPQGGVAQVAATGYRTVAGLFSNLRFPGTDGTTTASVAMTTSSSASTLSSSSASLAASDGTGTLQDIATKTKPKRLTKTGPESLGFLVATLMAAYCMVLHTRARNRVGVELVA